MVAENRATYSLILERRKEFESILDIEKTIEICRELCRNEGEGDEDNIDDANRRFPQENPFADLYANPVWTMI